MKLSRKFIRILLTTFFVVVLLFTCNKIVFGAEVEKINSFDSTVTVNNDSSIFVTETIKYDFGNNQRHGLLRYIPVIYQTSFGNISTKLYDIHVVRDNIDELFSVTQNANNKEIKIGNQYATLSGEHTYIITYKVESAIAFYKDIDEIYWNMTGNDWQVGIEKVTGKINLPVEVNMSAIQKSCYIGIYGSQEKCEMDVSLNSVSFVSKRPLGPGEGVTIAVGFPKGIVHEPTKLEKIFSAIKDNIIVLVPIIIFILMFWVWRKFGKDPKGLGTIVTEYEPPQGMKPTMVGALVDGKPDFRDITAGLIYLAEQGYISLEMIYGGGTFEKADFKIKLIKNDVSGLEKIEKDILEMFFEDSLTTGKTILMSSLYANTVFFDKLNNLLENIYQEMINSGFYKFNPENAKSILKILGVAIIFPGLIFGGIYFGFAGFVSAILSGIIVLIFGKKIGNLTKSGAEMRDRILGFKIFLSMTEKDRLDFHNAPERRSEEFMKFLPYAIALGIENKWADQFNGVYVLQPGWYKSNDIGQFSAKNMLKVSAISHSLGKIRQINRVGGRGSQGGGFSSSGRGSGGGGFSGGGRGGGGGGSW